MNDEVPEQLTLFKLSTEWQREWQNMPEFEMKDRSPYKTITVNFLRREDLLGFATLIGQRLTQETDSVWYPEVERKSWMDWRYSYES